MERKQVFGWTEAETPAEGYVKTLMAFARPDGLIDIEVRDRDARIVCITVERAGITGMIEAATAA